MDGKIIPPLPFDNEIRLFKKPDDAGAVGDPSGDDFLPHYLVNRSQRFLPVVPQPLGNLHGAPPCGVVGAAEFVPDVHHAFPRIKNIVVFEVVVNGDFLAGAEFGFDGGDMVVGANFAGGRVLFIPVPNDENIEGVGFQPAANDSDKFVQNFSFVGGRNFLLKAQGHAAIGLGKSGLLNQTAGHSGIANQDFGGRVPHLVGHRCPPALERLENHISL